jgi:flagellar biosynthesis/type III secretory pathway M-ring protein FliF/YscJ
MRENEITNYELSRTIQNTVQPKGSIRRLSVAVTLNHKTVAEPDENGTVTTKLAPYSEEELARYTALVMAAVGYNELRGDRVTLTSAEFYDDVVGHGTSTAGPWYVRIQRQGFFLPLIKYLVLILVFVLIYLIFVHPLRKRVIKAIEASAPALPPAEENLLLAAGEESAGALPEGEAGALPEGASDELPVMSFEPEEEEFDMENATDEQIEDMLLSEEMAMGKGARRYAVIKKMMIEKARRNPEMISQLIRSIMQEKA